MRRSLIHFGRIHLAVVAGAAVATAVLTGALVVGDSVRGSLRDMVLERLGGIDVAVLAPRPVPADLATRLGADPRLGAGRVAPALALTGSVVHADSGARATDVAVTGVDETFGDVFGAGRALDLARAEGQLFPSVIVNETLAHELGAEPGDAVLLHVQQAAEVARDSLMGDRDVEDVVRAIRYTVRAVLPDEGLGRFGVIPRQQAVRNAFVELGGLQRAVELRGEANALYVAGADETAVDAALGAVLTLADLGLRVEPADGHAIVESADHVLSVGVEETVLDAAGDAAVLPVQSYLANSIEAGGRSVPYSTVAAIGERPARPWASLTLVGGGDAPTPGAREVLLNAWAASDLGVKAGDDVTLRYFVLGPGESLEELGTTFRVAGVVAMTGLAADRRLTPEYPGLRDAEDMAAWDPPFPVDLDRVRPKDEAYWDEWRATPKAFVSAATGRELWATRYGAVTSVKVDLPDDAGAGLERLRGALLDRLGPASGGLTARAVKREGLAAAQGATDFAGLFIRFSLFLIVAAAMLVGLLFGLGVERRGREVGLLLAVGWPARKVSRRFLGEGLVLAVLGAVIGVAGGVGYAALLMAGLRGMWRGAVNSSRLFLHVEPLSLAMGGVIAVAVVLFAIWRAVRRVRRIAPPALLAGVVAQPSRRSEGRVARIVAAVALVAGLGMLGYALASGADASPGLAFGSGACLLIAGLAAFATWCRATGRRSRHIAGARALWGMAARNSAWNPGRSILSVALVAVACFVIVTVAANRREFGSELERRDTGTGGFALLAESDIPLWRDLNDRGARAALGFRDDDAALGGVDVVPLRLRPGDDASCLNLYRPDTPRVLGVPDALIERGAFRFADSIDVDPPPATPWDLLRLDLGDDVVPAIADKNSAQWILKLGLGDEIALPDERGGRVRLRLVALLDTSVLQSEVLIAEGPFLERFPSHAGARFFLIDAPFDRAGQVATTLEATLAPFGFDATGTVDRLEAYAAVEHTYLATFQVLGGLGLLLGTIGLAVVLVRNLAERRGELATLRAFGFRRATLARLVFAENTFLLACGVAIGTVSALVAVAPRLATIHVPWGSLAATLGAVVVVGTVAGVVASRGVLRVPLLPALKAE